MYYLKVFIIFSFIFCFPPDVFAKMYKWVDEKGQTHLSDRPKPLDPSIDLSESSVSQKQLPGDIISLDFNDTDIKIILRLMASVGKISITWGSDVKGKITTKLRTFRGTKLSK